MNARRPILGGCKRCWKSESWSSQELVHCAESALLINEFKDFVQRNILATLKTHFSHWLPSYYLSLQQTSTIIVFGRHAHVMPVTESSSSLIDMPGMLVTIIMDKQMVYYCNGSTYLQVTESSLVHMPVTIIIILGIHTRMRCQSRCVHLPANSTPTHSAS